MAVTEGGVYRGSIIGETEDFVIQQVSKRSAVAHPKELLNAELHEGQRLAITYSGAHAAVREIRERSRTVGMER